MNLNSILPPQKRPRPVKSCLSCRTRKLKCDREQPCSQCVKNRRPEHCFYDERAGSLGQASEPIPAESSSEGQARTKEGISQSRDPSSVANEVTELRVQVAKLENLIQRMDNSQTDSTAMPFVPHTIQSNHLQPVETAGLKGLRDTRSLISLVSLRSTSPCMTIYPYI
jgi:hypothetical protein